MIVNLSANTGLEGAKMAVHHTAASRELAGLARHLRGRVILPADQDWGESRRPWNRRVDQRPEAVVDAEDAGDLAVTTVSPALRAAGAITVWLHSPAGHDRGPRPVDDRDGPAQLRRLGTAGIVTLSGTPGTSAAAIKDTDPPGPPRPGRAGSSGGRSTDAPSTPPAASSH